MKFSGNMNIFPARAKNRHSKYSHMKIHALYYHGNHDARVCLLSGRNFSYFFIYRHLRDEELTGWECIWVGLWGMLTNFGFTFYFRPSRWLYLLLLQCCTRKEGGRKISMPAARYSLSWIMLYATILQFTVIPNEIYHKTYLKFKFQESCIFFLQICSYLLQYFQFHLIFFFSVHLYSILFSPQSWNFITHHYFTPLTIK